MSSNSSPAKPQYPIPERQNNLAIYNGNYLTDLHHYITQVWSLKRIVLVASKTLYANPTQPIQALETQLSTQIVAKHIGVGTHSPYSDVVAIAHLLQDHQADGLLCIGSSSYSDASKIASKLARTLPPGFSESDLEALIPLSKGSAILKPADGIKVLLVPTSLSAAEWNGVGSCTNAKGKKQHFGCGSMKDGAADLVLCDPRIAATAPRELWLASGARCIDHLIETVGNRECTPQAEKDALKGLEGMIVGLRSYAVAQREGREARDEEPFLRGVAAAQEASCFALQDLILHGNTFGPSHAIGHQLGSIGKIGHGVTSCVLLGPVLKYTGASDDPVFERAKEAQEGILEVFNRLSPGREFASAGDAVTAFFAELGLPTTLTEVGVTDEERLDRIAEATLTDVWGGGEAQIREKVEVRKILETARG